MSGSAEERKAAFRAAHGKDPKTTDAYASTEQQQKAQAEQKHDIPASSSAARQAARGDGVDKPVPMSGYTHLKPDDDGPPEATGLSPSELRQGGRDQEFKSNAGQKRTSIGK